MKKIFLFTSLIVLAITVNAQTLKFQSALSYLVKGQLDKAKTNIDEVCEDKSTMNDAKTWKYKADIYYRLGTTGKIAYKDLIGNPLQIAYESAVKCIELDKSKEYADEINTTLRLIGSAMFNKGVVDYENGDYKNVAANFNNVVEVNKLTGDSSTTNDAKHNAALAEKQLRSTQ
jgi:tetratricopeptide (TPR) repeat protein